MLFFSTGKTIVLMHFFVQRQLELQMEAERNRRKQLLDTQAQINVAEGQKQRVILESEGHVSHFYFDFDLGVFPPRTKKVTASTLARSQIE